MPDARDSHPHPTSGADQATFGEGYAKQLTSPGGADGVGLGTYATSVLFQVAPKAHVTAVDVYRKGKVDRGAVGEALHWAREHAADLDAVVLAFPPASLLDPMAAGLAEPAGHPWSRDVKILGGTAGPGSADLSERITTSGSAKREVATVAAGETRPVPAVQAVADGVGLTLPPGRQSVGGRSLVRLPPPPAHRPRCERRRGRERPGTRRGQLPELRGPRVAQPLPRTDPEPLARPATRPGWSSASVPARCATTAPLPATS